MKKFLTLLCLVYATYTGKLLFKKNQKMMEEVFPSKSYERVAKIIRNTPKKIKSIYVDNMECFLLPKGSVLGREAGNWYYLKNINSKGQKIPKKFNNACLLLVKGRLAFYIPSNYWK